MPLDIRIWEIQNGTDLREISQSKLDLEEKIEKWLESDISVLADDLIVIGRQVKTDFGGYIDLLCLDHGGDVVIIELKKERTPREITSQALDYASWVKDLSNERITEIAAGYFGGQEQFEDQFNRSFGEPLPEILNEQHKMLIVAAEVDSDSERIINYLSDSYGVSINAASFQYFQDSDGRELLARVFLIQPSEVEYKSKTKTASKRRPPLSLEELQNIASEQGVGEVFDQLVDALHNQLDYRTTTLSTVAFIGIVNDSRRTIFSLIPGESSQDSGVRYSMYIELLMEYIGATKEQITTILPPNFEEGRPWKGGHLAVSGYFRNEAEIDRFHDGLNDIRS